MAHQQYINPPTTRAGSTFNNIQSSYTGEFSTYYFSLQYSIVLAPQGMRSHISLAINCDCKSEPYGGAAGSKSTFTTKQHGNETHIDYFWQVKKDCGKCGNGCNSDFTYIRDRDHIGSDECMNEIVGGNWGCLADWIGANSTEEDWPDQTTGDTSNLPLPEGWNSGGDQPTNNKDLCCPGCTP